MILEREQWHLGYAQLLRDCRGIADEILSFDTNDDDDEFGIGGIGGIGGTGVNMGSIGNNISGRMGSMGSTGRVLILVAADADAMASARILSYMLRADGVPYQLRPCTGFWRMKLLLRKIGVVGVVGMDGVDGANNARNVDNAINADNMDEDGGNGNGSGSGSGNGNGGNHNDVHRVESDVSDVRAVVLINMGANRNLARLFTTNNNNNNNNNHNERNRCRCYVFDCHRPYHLSNIHAGKNVVLFNDRPFEEGEVPSDGDNLSGDESSSSEEEEEEEDESEEGDDGNAGDDGNNGNAGDDGGEEGEMEFDGEDVIGTSSPGRATSFLHSPRLDRRGRQGRRGEGQGESEGDEDADESEVEGSDVEGSPVLRKSIKRQKRDQRGQGDHNAGDASTSLIKPKVYDDDDFENPLDVTAATADLTLPSTQDSQDLEVNQISSPRTPQTAQPTHSSTSITSFRTLRRNRRTRIRLHYSSGSYHATPSSWLTYTLSSHLRFGDTSDLLWLACVGVTDAYLHGRLDVAGYGALCLDLKKHVGRLFPNELVDRVGRAVYAEDLEEGAMNAVGGGGSRSNGANRGEAWTRIGLSENGRILCQSEFRFMLLRHTSLWDAMFHSDFVATKLKVWTAQGRQMLMEFVAKMGFPLEQCRQPFAFVRPGMRRRLKERMEECSEEFGLDNLSYTGFVRVTGYKSLLSASDMSHAVTALLECSAAAMGTMGSSEATPSDDQDSKDMQGMENMEDRQDRDMMQAFNVAFDALNSNGSSLSSLPALSSSNPNEGSDLTNLVNGGNMTGTTGLGAGIRLAMTLQRTIMNTACNLVDRNAITRLSHFRYAYINCTSGGSVGGVGGGRSRGSGTPASRVVTPDITRNVIDGTDHDPSSNVSQYHVFAKPLVLTKLAHFLMEMHRENGKWTGTKSRPLILLAEKPRSGTDSTYMVVGYECPEEAGNVVNNKFGQNFELAAKTIRGTFWFDSFDSNVVEVAGGDVQRFIEQLHYIMESV